MTDKVKILIKVTRRIDEILKMGDTGVTHLQELETLTDLQTFINSLTEEPVSKDLEEAATTFADVHVYATRKICFKAGAQWDRQKSINKTVKWLKENARLYLITHSGCIDDYDDKTLIEDFRKVLEEE